MARARAGRGPGRRRAFVRAGCFPRATRMEGDSQVCGWCRRLAPGPCAGLRGWSVPVALGLGNFWPMGPAGTAQVQGVERVPRPARRCCRRTGAAGPAATSLHQPNLGSRGGRGAATWPPAAGPAPRSAGDRGERDGETSSSTSKVGPGCGSARGGQPEPRFAPRLHPVTVPPVRPESLG